MHIILVGCGRVGSELVRRLSDAKHTISMIDRKKSAFERLGDLPQGVEVFEGYGFDRDTLEKAGIANAGAYAAVTSGDNTNIMCARVARETFGITKVVARIYDPRRASLYERLGIPTVASVQWTTDQVIRRLLIDEQQPEWRDPSGGITIVEQRLPTEFAGKPMSKLERPGSVKVVGVTRLGSAMLASPELIGQDGDTVYLAVHAAHNTDPISDVIATALTIDSIGGGH